MLMLNSVFCFGLLIWVLCCSMMFIGSFFCMVWVIVVSDFLCFIVIGSSMCGNSIMLCIGMRVIIFVGSVGVVMLVFMLLYFDVVVG